MSDEQWNKIAIFVILLSLGIDLIALFATIRAQRLEVENTQYDDATKEEIRQLHNEIAILKIQLRKIKE